MKKILLILYFLTGSVLVLQAQETGGFNFKAQVLDENGKLLISEKINLDITLFSAVGEYYQETQDVRTDASGYFNINIGGGNRLKGNFNQVPWHKQDISLKLSYRKENSQTYLSLGTSRLYSVPYAYYARQAGEIISSNNVKTSGTPDQTGNTVSSEPAGSTETDSGIASKSEQWSMYGNRLAGMRKGFIGTTDSSPLIFKSAGKERAQFNNAGQFALSSDLIMGPEYAAKLENAEIGSLNVKGIDSRMQNLHIQGLQKATSANTGALIVDGGVGINDALFVKQNIITESDLKARNIDLQNGSVTGNLTVNNLTKLNDPTESTKASEGALTVAGGVGIAKNLNVGQNLQTMNLQVDGVSKFNTVSNNSLVVNDAITSNNLKVLYTTELNALKTTGVTTLSKNVTIGEDEKSALLINGMATFNSPIVSSNLTESTNPKTGSLILSGGAGISKNLNVGQKILTQDLEVTGISRFNTVANTNLVVDNLTTTKELKVTESADLGMLTVNGAAFLRKNTVVGEDDRSIITVNGTTAFNAPAKINNNAESSSYQTGALTVSGGAGIMKNLFVGGKIQAPDIQADGTGKFHLINGAELNIENAANIKSLKVTESTELKSLSVSDKANFRNDVAIGDASQPVNLNIYGSSRLNGVVAVKDVTESTKPDEGALTVSGGAGIARNLMVGQKVQAAELEVNGTARFNGPVLLNNANLTTDQTLTARLLKINENADIKDLTVNGVSDFRNDVTIGGNTNSNIIVNGKTNITGLTRISDATESSTAADGALTISGGAGIGKNLNVGQKIRSRDLQVDGSSKFTTASGTDLSIDNSLITKTLKVNEGADIKTLTVNGVSDFKNDVTIGGNTNSNIIVNGKTNITGITKITDVTESSTPQDGALTLAGGAGIAKNLNVGQKVITKDLQVAGDLQVDGNSKLNTVSNNNLKVENTLKTKILEVTDSSTLNSLTVKARSYFANDVDFGKTADNTRSNIGINGDVNLNGGFSSQLKVKNTADVIKGNYTDNNGSINIEGGARVAKNLNVSGFLAVREEISARKIDAGEYSKVKITEEDDVTTATADDKIGALNVAGGARVDKNMSIGGGLRLEGKFKAVGGIESSSSLTIDPYTKFADAASGTAKQAGAVSDDLRVEDKDKFALYLNSINHGIAIKVNRNDTRAVSDSDFGAARTTDAVATPTKDNEFISFIDKNNNIIGSIEGQTLDDMHNSMTFRHLERSNAETRSRRAIELAISVSKVVITGIKMKDAIFASAGIAVSSAAAADAAVPHGLAAPYPGVSAGFAFIGSFFANLTTSAPYEVAQIIQEITNIGVKANSLEQSIGMYEEKKSDMERNVGIKYTSRSADYAEWLLLLNTSEAISKGDVVGVVGGKIIKDYTHTAVEKYMVVSTAPALGMAEPSEAEKPNYRQVAFIGQVPVTISGNVNIGDYILPDNMGQGFAVAKSKSNMQITDYKKIIGVAWSVKNSQGKVNVAVGINNNDMSEIITAQDQKITALDTRLKVIEDLIKDIRSPRSQTVSDSMLAVISDQNHANEIKMNEGLESINNQNHTITDLENQIRNEQNKDIGSPSGNTQPGNTSETNVVDNMVEIAINIIKSDEAFRSLIEDYIRSSKNDMVRNFRFVKAGKEKYVKEFVENDFIKPIKDSLSSDELKNSFPYSSEKRDDALDFYSAILQKYFITMN